MTRRQVMQNCQCYVQNFCYSNSLRYLPKRMKQRQILKNRWVLQIVIIVHAQTLQLWNQMFQLRIFLGSLKAVKYPWMLCSVTMVTKPVVLLFVVVGLAEESQLISIMTLHMTTSCYYRVCMLMIFDSTFILYLIHTCSYCLTYG